MSVPTWLSAVGHVASDVFGAALGVGIAEGGVRAKIEKVLERGGQVLRERFQVSEKDREEVMKELLRLGGNGQEVEALRKLLTELQKRLFIVVEGLDERGRPYRRYHLEARTVNLLLQVDPPDRQWVYPTLNEVLVESGREEFFALLGIIEDDGWHGLMSAAWDVARTTSLPVGRALKRAMQSMLEKGRAAAGATAGGVQSAGRALDEAAGRLAERLERVNDRFEALVNRAEARWRRR